MLACVSEVLRRACDELHVHPPSIRWFRQAPSLEGMWVFGLVFDGQPTLSGPAGSFTLSPGMCFSLPGAGSIGGAGRGIVAARLGYEGFFQIGGPVEAQGRLRFIDGCTDSLLIPPVLCGDPCPAAFNGDGSVGAEDLAQLLGAWGPNPGHPADLDDNGGVGAFDLALLLGAWGLCP